MQPIPCPVRLVAGEHACPGCGLSRSTVLAMHGDFARSLRVNAAGILVLVLCAAGVAVHAHMLATRHRSRWHVRALRCGHRLFLIGVLAAWLVRMAA